jgi:hypothetical protein
MAYLQKIVNGATEAIRGVKVICRVRAAARALAEAAAAD